MNQLVLDNNSSLSPTTTTSTTTTTTTRRLSLDSGMDRLRLRTKPPLFGVNGHGCHISGDRDPQEFVVPSCHRLMDPYCSRRCDMIGNSSRSLLLRQLAQADLFAAAAAAAAASNRGTVEITGLELLMNSGSGNGCETRLEEDDNDCNYYFYDEDDDSISLVSYDISCTSMDSITNDSIELTRKKRLQQYSLKPNPDQIVWSSLSEETAEAATAAATAHAARMPSDFVDGSNNCCCRSAESHKRSSSSSNDSCSSKSAYSMLSLFSEQLLLFQDLSETITINTGGTNRAA